MAKEAATVAKSVRRRGRPLEAGPEAEKLSVLVARRIEAEVLRGGWRIGQSLGSEPKLMERYQVSRSTLREAVRQSEVHGFVKMSRGVGGGLIVASEPHEAAGRALTIHLDLLGADASELFEVRDILEPLGARLAAERASDADVQKLRDLLHALEAARPDFAVIAPMHAHLRAVVSEIAGNPALAVFVGALSRHSVEAIASRITPTFDTTSAERAAAWKRRLVEAIVARSPGQAETAMRAELRERMKALIPLFDEDDACRAQSGAPPAEVAPHNQPKLGQAVAMTMAAELRQGARKPGEKLGAEPDLLARYGVSRAVFREAIRILELHGFVRTRRGHAGGLLVWTPDPTYAIGAATEFLRASGMSGEHFTTIRQAISSKAAPLAAQRLTDAGRALLRDQLRLVLAAEGRNLVGTSQMLHKLVGDLSRNRALAIFNRVLLDLNMSPGGTILPDDVNAALRRNSERLCDAICAGDDLLAHRRMVEHMRNVADWTGRGLTIFR